MILADKISELRRKNNWSQEELAEMLDVSRQSVSKWESGNSIPDLNRIIKLSEIFGVSADYLIKDDAEPQAAVTVDRGEDLPGRNVSIDEATSFMDLIAQSAGRLSLGIALCIISPAVLITLAGMTGGSTEVMNTKNAVGIHLGFTENLAAGIGVAVLLVLVAIGVLMIVATNMRRSKYEFLESEPILLDYGVEGIVLKKKEAFEDTYRKFIVTGVGLCIVAPIPLIIAGIAELPDAVVTACVALLLVMIAVAVYMFTWVGQINGSYEKLLQQNDYSVENKVFEKKTQWLSTAYWGVVTAGYLLWSFAGMSWDRTWIVWPVAGVLFAAVKAVVRFKK